MDIPLIVPEIHFGFASGQFYIGKLDVSRCTDLKIEYHAETDTWKICAVFPNGEVAVGERRLPRGYFALVPVGMTASVNPLEMEKPAAATADLSDV